MGHTKRKEKVIVNSRKKPQGFDPKIIKKTNPFIGWLASEIGLNIIEVAEDCFHPVILFRINDDDFPEITLEIDIWGLDELTPPLDTLFDQKPNRTGCKFFILGPDFMGGKFVRWENLFNQIIRDIEAFSTDIEKNLTISYLPKKMNFFV